MHLIRHGKMQLSLLAAALLFGAAACSKEDAPIDLKKPIDLNKVNMVFSPIGGVFEGAQASPDQVIASGWAKLGDVSGPVDLVLILNQNNQLLAQAAPKGAREDVVKATNNPGLANSGFSIPVGIGELTSTGSVSLAAFAYSAKHNRANMLGNKWNIAFKDGKITGAALAEGK